APYGEPYTDQNPSSAGYQLVAPIVARYAVHIGWAIDTLDWNCTTGDATARKQCVYNNFTSKVQSVGTGDYGLVLMHAFQPQTADALGDIIDYCKTKGFMFKVAEDFVQAKFGKSSHDLVYGSCALSPYGGTARVLPGTVQVEDFDNGGPACAYD